MSSRSSRRRQGNEHILDRAESALSGRICVEVALTSVAIRDRRACLKRTNRPSTRTLWSVHLSQRVGALPVEQPAKF